MATATPAQPIAIAIARRADMIATVKMELRRALPDETEANIAYAAARLVDLRRVLFPA